MENKIVAAEVREVLSTNQAPKIHESVTNKTCFVDGKNTLSLYLVDIGGDIGTVNLCQGCMLNAEAERIKAKYNGNTKEMLKANAAAAGEKAKNALGKLWNFGKDLLK